MLSVLGQRMRPPRERRLLTLKVVASSPARFASPEADRPFLEANASMAFQISW